jgi:hypothetical protein
VDFAAGFVKRFGVSLPSPLAFDGESRASVWTAEASADILPTRRGRPGNPTETAMKMEKSREFQPVPVDP